MTNDFQAKKCLLYFLNFYFSSSHLSMFNTPLCMLWCHLVQITEVSSRLGAVLSPGGMWCDTHSKHRLAHMY